MIIECQDLSKRFKRAHKEAGVFGAIKSFFSPQYTWVEAVKDISFTVERGEILGLLGPNGAGKTTLMKMFTGIMAPSAGSVRVLGYEPFQRHKEFRRKISLVMGNKSQLWWDIPALDSFQLLRSYYELDKNFFKIRLAELAHLLDVEKLLTTHVRRLSLGERMKMEMIACLLHEPEILFLDEPTIGLDVVAQVGIREFILRYHREHNTTIVLTSHYMADVEALCQRVVMVLGGKKFFDGPIAEFEKILGRDKFVTVTFQQPVDIDDPIWPGLSPEWSPNRLGVELRIAETEFRRITTLILERFPVTDLSTDKLPIERVMKSIIGVRNAIRHE